MNTKTMRIVPIMAVSALMLSACATRTYTTVSGLSELEARNYDCSQLTREYVEARLVQSELSSAKVVSVRSVLSGPTDLGIGNLMARADARDAASDRLEQVRLTLAAKGCRPVDDSAFETDKGASMFDKVADNDLVRSTGRVLGLRQ